MNTRRQTRSATKAATIGKDTEPEPETITISTSSSGAKTSIKAEQPTPVKEKKRNVKAEKKVKSDKAKTPKKEVDKKIVDVVVVKEENNDNDNHDDEIIYQLDVKEMKEVNNAFDLNCSEDGEELLNSDDLKTAIRALGFEPRVHEIRKLLKKYATKGGKINRDSFHQIMALKMSNSLGSGDNVSTNDEISRVFNLLDLDKTGVITIDNLKSIAKELNEEIAEEELLEMIAEADTDGDMKINKLDFENIMKKTSLY